MPLYSVLCKEDIFIKADWQAEAMGNCLQREGFRLFVYKLSAWLGQPWSAKTVLILCRYCDKAKQVL